MTAAPGATPRRPRRAIPPEEAGILIPARFVAEWGATGYPWCDECGKPAVLAPGASWRHAAPGYLRGIPVDRDESGHRVTADDWWDLGARGDAGDAA